MASPVIVSYTSTRLLFRADVFEFLPPNGRAHIGTPLGTYEISKAEFDTDFPNVRKSRSYRGSRGHYHYPVPPKRALKYLKSGPSRLP